MVKSEPGSDVSSLKSVLKTPSEGGPRRVGFAPQRPTLFIPPPGGISTSPSTARSIPITAYTSPSPQAMAYGRKASVFVFDQISGLKNAAKSGLGIGEKCALWIYHKFSVWSRKWFTHAFLSIVLAIYSVGGAVMMKYVEGTNEKRIMDVDIISARKVLLQNLHESWSNQTIHATEREWMGAASSLLEKFEATLEDGYRIKTMRKANNGDFVWTLSNSVVYCATVYTTIDWQCRSRRAMDPTDLVTAEAVRVDEISKRRRRFTKKRASSRENTPTLAESVTSEEESFESVVKKSPRPERPRRRRVKNGRGESGGGSATETEVTGNESSTEIPTTQNIPKKYEDNKPLNQPFTNSNLSNGNQNHEKLIENLQQKRDELVEIAQVAHAEFLSFLDKTKKSLSTAAARGRNRFRKDKERVKRSQSAPHQLTEEELLESFKKAQMLSVDNNSYDQNKYYDNISLRSVTPEIMPVAPKPFRPEVQEFVRQRKKQRSATRNTKIIEILDPKTSEVVATKGVVKSNFRLIDLFSIFRFYSIKEIYTSYKEFKKENYNEFLKIKQLYKMCMLELFLIMIFCGCGGIIFKSTEGSFENYYKCGVKRVKRDFLDLLWIKSHNLREDDWKSMARNRLRIFEEELHAAHEAGMTSYSGQRSWNFLNGVVYCLTVVTTIGYGHLYPTTVTGKSLTIVYAIIGIPLFLIALTDFGKLFTRCIKFLWSFVRRLYYTGSCRKVRKTAHVQEIFKGAQLMYDIATFRRTSQLDPEAPMPPPSNVSGSLTTPTTPAIEEVEVDDEFNLPISVALSILLAYIFCGALLYMLWEQWNFFDAFYFVFISMSTIGFGDYVPSSNYLMVLSIVYLVFGLALMSMCINVVQVKLSDTFKHASAKIGATLGVSVAEDGSVYAIPADPVELVPVHMEPMEVEEITPVLEDTNVENHVENQVDSGKDNATSNGLGGSRDSSVENGLVHVVKEDNKKDKNDENRKKDS